MSEQFEFEFDLDELVEDLGEETLNIKNKKFSDCVNLYTGLSRQLFLSDIDYGTGDYFDSLIRFWNDYDNKNNIPIENREPIRIYINSGGGSLTDTFTIINAIELSKTPVYTIVTGCAYSGGFFTAIAGHKRFCYKNASFLYHEGATGSSGTANQFANYAAFYKRQLKQLKDIVLHYTDIDEDMYSEIQKDDFWMDATDALKYNCIDEICEEFI